MLANMRVNTHSQTETSWTPASSLLRPEGSSSKFEGVGSTSLCFFFLIEMHEYIDHSLKLVVFL